MFRRNDTLADDGEGNLTMPRRAWLHFGDRYFLIHIDTYRYISIHIESFTREETAPNTFLLCSGPVAGTRRRLSARPRLAGLVGLAAPPNDVPGGVIDVADVVRAEPLHISPRRGDRDHAVGVVFGR